MKYLVYPGINGLLGLCHLVWTLHWPRYIRQFEGCIRCHL